MPVLVSTTVEVGHDNIAARYRITDEESPMADEKYIPHARDAVVGYCDRLGRVHCVTCCDRLGLDMPPEHRVYGDLHDSTGATCDACGVSFVSLSTSCEREHDEQQERFARGPVTALVEYGIRAFPRCRIY